MIIRGKQKEAEKKENIRFEKDNSTRKNSQKKI
jgi:hypothetical protein